MASEIFILGLVILIGFVGNILFEYTKVPESLFMMLIGLIVGPVLGIAIQSEFLRFAPIVTEVTLIVILLDTGLSLDLFETVKLLGRAFTFTILVLLASTTLVGAFMFLLGWEPLHAILIGIISSGTTTIVVADLIPRLRVPLDIKQILIMESIINDVTLVTAAVMVINIIRIKSFDPSHLATVFAGSISISVLLGVSFTILWVDILWRFHKGRKLAYVFTLGVLFILCSLAEILGGNGAIAALVMALSLGNLPAISMRLRREAWNVKFMQRRQKTLQSLSERFKHVLNAMQNTQVNFAFFAKNFFFVYLGIIFDTNKISLILVGVCIGILLLMYASRYLSVRLQALVDPSLKEHATVMTMIVARGFTATFVALLPASEGIEVPLLKEIVLIMVLLSTFATMAGTVIYEKYLLTPANEGS